MSAHSTACKLVLASKSSSKVGAKLQSSGNGEGCLKQSKYF